MALQGFALTIHARVSPQRSRGRASPRLFAALCSRRTVVTNGPDRHGANSLTDMLDYIDVALASVYVDLAIFFPPFSSCVVGHHSRLASRPVPLANVTVPSQHDRATPVKCRFKCGGGCGVFSSVTVGRSDWVSSCRYRWVTCSLSTDLMVFKQATQPSKPVRFWQGERHDAE